ncbi:MAG: glycosyltransferase family 2 protein [Planctomycetes bacterium]|nr:glycosyltransferase family 2 protein [Planctomycetota bacterium]MBI3843868.1 glycosyltransferase family 2 protein [Planctomycetota bacterium]
MANAPHVSVVVPNFNGRSHLELCLASLAATQYPEARLEILVVDNGSRDGSCEFIRQRFPRVRLIPLAENVGYSPAANLGAQHATGEILAFLNNDTRVEPSWLAPLVDVLASGEADAASPKLMSGDGGQVHFAGGGANFHGIAFQRGMGEPDSEIYSQHRSTLYACGAAEAIRRDVFFEAGGFDSDFFAYYEDLDLGWRLWVLGKRVVFVPDSRVWHRHSATSRRIPVHKVRVLHLRNPLYAVFKNYDDESLRRVWPAAMTLTVRRSLYLSSLDRESFRIGSGLDGALEPAEHALATTRSKFSSAVRGESSPHPEETVTIPALAASDWVGYGDFLAHFPRLVEKRRAIQSRRRRPDSEILPLFLDPFWAVEQGDDYLFLQRSLESLFEVDALFPNARKSDRGPVCP